MHEPFRHRHRPENLKPYILRTRFWRSLATGQSPHHVSRNWLPFFHHRGRVRKNYG